MIHPLIISKGSAWSQSRLCAEADRERIAREAEITEQARKVHGKNLAVWDAAQRSQEQMRASRYRDPAVHPASLPADHPSDVSRRPHGGPVLDKLKAAKQANMEQMIETLRAKGHAMTSRQISEALPQLTRSMIEAYWPQLVTSFRVISQKGINPEYARQRLCSIKGGCARCAWYGLPEWGAVRIPEVPLITPDPSLTLTQRAVLRLLESNAEPMTRSAILAGIDATRRHGLDPALAALRKFNLVGTHIVNANRGGSRSGEHRAALSYFIPQPAPSSLP